MNTIVAHVNDPTRLSRFEDTYIRETLSREANRILKAAAVGLPEYPAALGILGGVPILAREVVVLADGSAWLYEEVPGGSVLTPDSLGICHKCAEGALSALRSHRRMGACRNSATSPVIGASVS